MQDGRPRQITGAILDGPLAMDGAIILVVAKTKGLVSAVAGKGDILVVPNIEAGNILAKQFIFLANADAAGVALLLAHACRSTRQ